MKKSNKKTQFYIIAGPNGSGKTTFAKEFLPYDAGCLEFVNVDMIAGGLSPFADTIESWLDPVRINPPLADSNRWGGNVKKFSTR